MSVVLYAFCALLLTACALAPSAPGGVSPSRAALDAFAMECRFSLRNEDKNYAGRLSWRHGNGRDELLLSSPLGQGMAEIVSEPSGARLTASDGKVYSAVNVETLTRDVLGYPLPLAQLTDWVRGRLRDADESTADAQGRPLRQRAAQWRIEYGYESDDPAAPPNRIFAERLGGGLELRLRIDEWNLLPYPASQP
ncbi:MAG: lipoprotein insertase outer membrane protein LolB [Propionivibrio sp.]